MTKPVSLSADYVYDAPSWVFHWLVGFLWDRLEDPVDQEDLRGQTLGDYIHLGELSGRARFCLLQALAQEVVGATQSFPFPYGEGPSEGRERLREELEPLARSAASALSGTDAPGPAPTYRMPLVVVSGTYDWPMPFGSFDFVVRLLRERLGTDAVPLQDSRVDLRRLEGSLRNRALRVLADEAEDEAHGALASMVVGSPGHHGGYWDHGRALKEVRVLALIARQVLREDEAGASCPTEGTLWPWPAPGARTTGTRRIILDEDDLWTADAAVYRQVIEFLSRRPGLPLATKKFVDAPWLDLSAAFSAADRLRVLRALSVDLPDVVEGEDTPIGAGNLRTLALMASDVLASRGSC